MRDLDLVISQECCKLGIDPHECEIYAICDEVLQEKGMEAKCVDDSFEFPRHDLKEVMRARRLYERALVAFRARLRERVR